MKKTFLVAFTALISFTTLKAQEKIVELKASASSIKIGKVPFSNVSVIDGRIDTLKIGMAQVGAFNKLEPIRFNEPAAVSIQKYIQELIINSPTVSKKLLVKIERLTTLEKTFATHEKGYIDFAAEAYLEKNDSSYIKLFSTDTFYVIKALDVTKAVLSKIPDLIDSMIYKISVCDLSAIDTNNIVSFNEINSGISKQWAQFPINTSSYGKGVYKSFEDFRNNLIDSSTDYVITSTDNGSYKVFESKDSLSMKKRIAKNVWGINTGNNPYICLNNDFIPLERKNNTFYFIASIKDFPKQTVPESTNVKISGLSDDSYYGTLSGLILTAVVNRKSEFYLDMDTGSIIEYRIIER